ncbi:efflux RND transporter periplasmic adaptor subunit [Rhodopseudomonas palustris]|uniref:HlyD family secretion protein n=1 Tax=Rhodopseudomonas palustris TaxID=1076 RepID=UPI000E5B55F4|nr:efflux RND transporter periplasmic adaptor subunit [Rhodopseudomonas palustris]QLH69879.1 efflux RND transporter periplasmic adaptor subunit [Rhodopseudomonas palustris]RIA03523.1 HlyD family efflux transporter periplasmic adaptor subunit [Rhodopseudomonas palustris]WBU30568.1 efflux RND transporter periplasmic adaptor subunit [Rhodopseudomonas palustris]
MTIFHPTRRGVRLFSALCLGAGILAGPLPAHADDKFDKLIQKLMPKRLPEGFASANGRLESEQVEIATKLAGRIAEVLVKEGDEVEKGQLLVKMDVSDIQAQLLAAEAQERRAVQSKAVAEAMVLQRESEQKLAAQQLGRAEALFEKGFSTAEIRDQRQAAQNVADASLIAAKASLSDATAAIDAARAEVARIKTVLDDMQLKAPRRGRIQYKLAQAGEVLGAGSRVLTLVDLTDVYMTVFVPASVAAALAYGSDARLILDAIPQYVVPAKVTFVASEAQFTPKAVETKDEREKLMFRVKLTLPPDLLRKYEREVKTGVRGMAYLRTDSDKQWPDNLKVKLPQ